jgi:DUF4097 and DUF4098 domain-containing protein YvlB
LIGETFLYRPPLTERTGIQIHLFESEDLFMLGKLIRFVSVSTLLGTALAATASAQDFQKPYQLASGGTIRIGNISGEISIKGYDGATVIVTGRKEGADVDLVQIEDRSTSGGVDVTVHYPNNCHNCNVSVNFQIQVPRSVSYRFDRIRSVSGDVDVSGITGSLNASTVSGSVRVTDLAGSVSAHSVSGDVEVQLSRLEGVDDMSFNTVSGGVTVKLPAGLDANIEMSSFSGSIDTDFPIQIHEDRYTSSRRASGQVGSGARRLKMSTVSGSLSLRQI